MKWGEVQLGALKLMNLIDSPKAITDLIAMRAEDDYSVYLNNMPEACNRALNRICTNYKYILKKEALTLETTDVYNRYDLKVLIPDFYKFISLIKEIPAESYYQKTLNYKFEGESTIIIPNDSEATYSVEYYAYPTQMSLSVLDTFVLDVSNEVAVLLPLYIASELYKDDDIAIATTYRNEFEVGIAELNNVGSSEAPQFESSTGWL